MIYQNATHGDACTSKEVGAGAQIEICVMHQAEEGFMHQRCGLKGMVAALAAHVAKSLRVKLSVEEAQQARFSFLIAIPERH
jgi:hypothetical protein